MKTPEELAREYADGLVFDEGMFNTAERAFLAGYQAAKDQLDTALASRNAWKEDAERYAESADYWKAQAAAPQWTSVKERLPEEGQDCVIYVDWVDVWDKGSERITYQEIAVFNGEDRFYHRSHTELNRVTHWMPLPKPPEEV